MTKPTLRARGYRLEPFGPEGWPAALEVLARAYPQTPREWWNAGLRRLVEVPPNDEQRPLGKLMHGPHGASGAGLLFSARRPQATGGRWHVNASSWAIDADARLQALWMIGEALDEPDAVYTALTPIPSALRILKRVGFEPVSHQRVVVFTPRTARLPAAKYRVLNEADTLAAFRGHGEQRLLDDHVRLGCTVCAIETPEGLEPLVLRARRQSRVVPSMEVLYARSTQTIAAAIGPMSRHLLARGKLLLDFEAAEDADFDIPCTRLYRRRFARGPYVRAGIDHLYSELVYLGIG